MTFKSVLGAALAGILPDRGSGLRRVYRHFWERRRNRLLERRASAGPWRQPSPLRVLTLSPANIELHTNFQPPGQQRELRNRVFGPDVLPGAVVDGDWDLECEPFDRLAAYQSIHARIHKGTPWRDTSYFAESMRDIDNGRPLWNCHNADQLDQRLAYVDALIDSIRTYGLLRQRDVGGAQDPTRRYSDELEVNIGRDGRFLFQDGRHRLCVVKALALPHVTVKVRARHPQWLQVREAILNLTKRRAGQSPEVALPQPAPHPDLDDIAASADAPRALSAVVRTLGAAPRRVLDLHARLGYFSHALEALGHEVTALECDSQWHRLAQRLHHAQHRHFALLNDAATLTSQPPFGGFDVGLLLAGLQGWPMLDQHEAALQALIDAQAVHTWVVCMPTNERVDDSVQTPGLPAPITSAVGSGRLAAPVRITSSECGITLVTLTRPLATLQP